MEQQVFLCPLCNAPHDEKLQPGTLQVKCKYCGGVILVPSRLSGLYQWCPDHPDFLSVGLCTQCGRNCCDVCLHALERTGAPARYLCPKCTKKALRRESAGYAFMVACSLTIIIPMVVALLAGPPRLGSTEAGALLVYGVIVLACAIGGRLVHSGPVPTLREKKQEVTGPSGYAWEQCPFCNAGYSYPLCEIGSDRAVTCQNCGRRFEVDE